MNTVLVVILSAIATFIFIRNKRKDRGPGEPLFRKIPVSKFEINFHPDSDSFDCSDRPAYSHECTYQHFLEEAIRYGESHKYHKEAKEAFAQLLEQEHEIVRLCEKLTTAVKRIKGLDDVTYLQSTINGVIDSYKQNRADAIEAIRAYAIADPRTVKEKEWLETVVDIPHDNEQFISELTDLYNLIHEHDALVNRDATLAHITDFNSLDKLRELNSKLHDSTTASSSAMAIDATGKFYPTGKAYQPRKVMTVLSTDIPLQPQHLPDVPTINVDQSTSTRQNE